MHNSNKRTWIDRTITIIGWLIIGLILPIATGLVLHRYENQTALNKLLITNGFIPLRENYVKCQNISIKYLSQLEAIYAEDKIKLSLARVIMTNDDPRYVENAIDELQYLLLHPDATNTKINQYRQNMFQCRAQILGIMSNMALLLDLEEYINQQTKKLNNNIGKVTSLKAQKVYYKQYSNYYINNMLTSPINSLVNMNLQALRSLSSSINFSHLSNAEKLKIKQKIQKNTIVAQHNLKMAAKSETIWIKFFMKVQKKFTSTYKKKLHAWL